MARGIAAVVDAIFLLLIAAIASGIVLSSAAHYGQSFNQQAQKLLLNYYAKEVVRTLVTASVMREGDVPDYLLAYIKESVEKLGDIASAEEALRQTVKKAMYPIKDRYDYVVALDSHDSSWGKTYIIYRVTTEGGTEEGTAVYDKGNYHVFADWVKRLGSEVYTSATTIFMRYCQGTVCNYIPTKVRVILFRRGIIEPPSSQGA